MSKYAVILAGGLGSRLRPYTTVLPKPLMPIGSYPILEVVIRQLAKADFKQITLAVNHQADIIKAYFDTGNKWGVKINYSLEHKPLGTMGPLKLIANLPENFLVMNGDVLTDLNFNSFFHNHIQRKNEFTISTCRREMKSEFGVLNVGDDGILKNFQEKPITTYNVSMGIYMLNCGIIDLIPNDTYYGFDDLMLAMITAGKKVHTLHHSGYWLDIGRPDDYEQAIELFEKEHEKFLPKVTDHHVENSPF